MMLIAALLFGLTALGGATLLTLRLRGGNPPLLIVRAHGVLAAISVLTLVVAILVDRAYGAPLVALGVFVAAGGIGLWMASRHVKGHVVPIGAVFLHLLVVLLGASALAAHFIS